MKKSEHSSHYDDQYGLNSGPYKNNWESKHGKGPTKGFYHIKLIILNSNISEQIK